MIIHASRVGAAEGDSINRKPRFEVFSTSDREPNADLASAHLPAHTPKMGIIMVSSSLTIERPRPDQRVESGTKAVSSHSPRT